MPSLSWQLIAGNAQHLMRRAAPPQARTCVGWGGGGHTECTHTHTSVSVRARAPAQSRHWQLPFHPLHMHCGCAHPRATPTPHRSHAWPHHRRRGGCGAGTQCVLGNARHVIEAVLIRAPLHIRGHAERACVRLRMRARMCLRAHTSVCSCVCARARESDDHHTQHGVSCGPPMPHRVHAWQLLRCCGSRHPCG